jgi:hypothetical protein
MLAAVTRQQQMLVMQVAGKEEAREKELASKTVLSKLRTW